MLKADALSMAVDSIICIRDMQHEMLHAVVGSSPEACKIPHPEIDKAIVELMYRASQAVQSLSSHARDARLNLIWRDFVAAQKSKLEAVK